MQTTKTLLLALAALLLTGPVRAEEAAAPPASPPPEARTEAPAPPAPPEAKTEAPAAPAPREARIEPPAPADPREVRIPPEDFEIVSRSSGPVNYYSVVSDESGAFIRAAYQPPYKTAVVGVPIPEDQRRSIARLRWKWRARVLPENGDECADGRGDSAAVVYITWKRGLRWYTIKYVWSAVGAKGRLCDKKRNPFVAQDTVIVESGGPLNEWRGVEIDPDFEFRKHFEGGDPEASVPNLIGLGIMSDGDQTRSRSEADFGGFSYRLR